MNYFHFFVLLYENKCDHLLGMSLENRGKTPGCHCTGHFSSGRQAGKGHRRHSAGRMLLLDPEPIRIRVRDSPPTLTAVVPPWSLNSFRVLWEALLMGHQLCKWHQQWQHWHPRLCHSPTSAISSDVLLGNDTGKHRLVPYLWDSHWVLPTQV